MNPNAIAIAGSFTPMTTQLLKDLIADAPNWSGNPIFEGNALRGNLTQLKKARLVKTFTDRGDTFIEFTDLGVEVADVLTPDHHLRLFY